MTDSNPYVVIQNDGQQAGAGIEPASRAWGPYSDAWVHALTSGRP
jgi:hypothetical protein